MITSTACTWQWIWARRDWQNRGQFPLFFFCTATYLPSTISAESKKKWGGKQDDQIILGSAQNHCTSAASLLCKRCSILLPWCRVFFSRIRLGGFCQASLVLEEFLNHHDGEGMHMAAYYGYSPLLMCQPGYAHNLLLCTELHRPGYRINWYAVCGVTDLHFNAVEKSKSLMFYIWWVIFSVIFVFIFSRIAILYLDFNDSKVFGSIFMSLVTCQKKEKGVFGSVSLENWDRI